MNSQRSESQDQKHIFAVAFGFIFALFLLLRPRPPQNSVERTSPKEILHANDDVDDSSARISLTGPNITNPHARPPSWKTALDVCTFLVAAGAFAAACIYAGISYRMWREMQTQTVNSERAWVGLDIPITLDVVEVNSSIVKIKGHYSLKNFGQGPAFKTIEFGNFVDPADPKMAESESDIACEAPVKFATGTVPIGGDLKQPPPFGRILFSDQKMDRPIDFNGTVQTVAHYRFVGCIAYIDQFKSIHWTRFCMERRPGDLSAIPKLDFCALYNDTDEPKKK
jgi:hypothetical protein